MSDQRIHEQYRSYDLIAALRSGKYRGRIIKNNKVISDIEGNSLEEVYSTLQIMVDDIILERIEKRGDARFDAHEHIDTIKAIVNLRPITIRDDLERAFDTFKEYFMRDAHVYPNHRVGFQGGGHNCDVYWHGALGVWGLFEPSLAKSRYWICYGLQNPADNSMLTITVETNPPFEGVNRRCAGAFLQDREDNLYIAHSGNVGGGRKGIGKTAFREYTQNELWKDVVWPNGESSLYRVISRLDAPDLPARMAEFVHEVAHFKLWAVSG